MKSGPRPEQIIAARRIIAADDDNSARLTRQGRFDAPMSYLYMRTSTTRRSRTSARTPIRNTMSARSAATSTRANRPKPARSAKPRRRCSRSSSFRPYEIPAAAFSRRFFYRLKQRRRLRNACANHAAALNCQSLPQRQDLFENRRSLSVSCRLGLTNPYGAPTILTAKRQGSLQKQAERKLRLRPLHLMRIMPPEGSKRYA